MITITIGNARRDLEGTSESWITEQIVRRRLEGQHVCVRVEIETGAVNMGLATPGCASGGGGRRPNATEARVFELWRQCRLDDRLFTPENLITFLKRVLQLV